MTETDYKVKYVLIAGEPPPRKPEDKDKLDEKKPAEKKK